MSSNTTVNRWLTQKWKLNHRKINVYTTSKSWMSFYSFPSLLVYYSVTLLRTLHAASPRIVLKVIRMILYTWLVAVALDWDWQRHYYWFDASHLVVLLPKIRRAMVLLRWWDSVPGWGEWSLMMIHSWCCYPRWRSISGTSARKVAILLFCFIVCRYFEREMC